MMKLLGLAAVLAAAPLSAREAANVIMPTDPAALALQNQLGFADAVIAGDMVYLSGVIAVRGETETSFVPSYERAFAQVGAILQRAGVSWDDVVDLTTLHTDLTSQAADIIAVKDRYVKPPFTAWTAFTVSKLYVDRGVTEIKVVAYRPKK